LWCPAEEANELVVLTGVAKLVALVEDPAERFAFVVFFSTSLTREEF